MGGGFPSAIADTIIEGTCNNMTADSVGISAASDRVCGPLRSNVCSRIR